MAEVIQRVFELLEKAESAPGPSLIPRHTAVRHLYAYGSTPEQLRSRPRLTMPSRLLLVKSKSTHVQEDPKSNYSPH
jgi:hypothetical protein